MNSRTLLHREASSINISAPSLWWRKFWIRLGKWEYWPLYIFSFPVVLIWLWHAAKMRDLFFFTLANPGLVAGGLFGESKSKILHFIPDEFKPKTILLKTSIRGQAIDTFMEASELNFPLIVKPEIGERGWLVSKVENLHELKTYLEAHPIDFVVQPFIDYPLEISILIHKMPDTQHTRITSICEKEFLHVKGNGESSVRELILMNDRAMLQYENLCKKLGSGIDDILSKGKRLLLEPVGNHCRGTKFINRNDQSDEPIRRVMTRLLNSIPGVCYGRFDMKIASWEALREGKNIMVLEFNGANSDPAHVFDPGYSLVGAYRDYFRHWNIMSEIARVNKRAGLRSDSVKKIISAFIIYIRYKRAN